MYYEGTYCQCVRDMIPILKTKLPEYEVVAPYIRQIDSNGTYSNFGPLNHALTNLLSQRYEVDIENICLVSSGTAGLFASLWVLINEISKQPSEIVVGVPAWTFIATAQIPYLLGTKVQFIDVNNQGFVSPLQDCTLDILLVVSPFGEKVDLSFWNQYQNQTGTKVLLDCAAAFSTLVADHIPAVVSTHATKGFSTGEGGFVVSKNKDFIKKVKMFSNFGFNYSRNISNFGLNFKLSEINCAYGLAALNRQSQYVDFYLDQVLTYDELLNKAGSIITTFNSSFMRTTYNIVLPKRDFLKDKVILSLLKTYGIELREWWGKPVAYLPHFKSTVSDSSKFPTADELYSRVLGLPLGCHINYDLQKYIVESLIQVVIEECMESNNSS